MNTKHKLFIHVGLPKTGTTSIQAALEHNLEQLHAAGVMYPLAHRGEQFWAAVELTRWHKKFGLDRRQIRGTWASLVDRGRASDRTVLISHEILGRLSDAQIASMLSRCDDFEVHVIITARDLGRQLPAVHQERVKNGLDQTLAEYVVDSGLAHYDHSSTRTSSNFWLEQDLWGVIERWSTSVPHDRIHLVTCPPSGADPHTLLERFLGVVGVSLDDVELPESTANQSLGVAEIELLRRVNVFSAKRLSRAQLLRWSKGILGQRVLPHGRSAKQACPSWLKTTFEEVTAAWCQAIETSRIVVHGDLADLTPVRFDPPDAEPITDNEVVAMVPAATVELLRVLTRQQSHAASARARRSPAG